MAIVIAITVSLVAVVVFDSVDITWSTTTQVVSHHLFRTEPDESVPASSDTIIWNLRAPQGVPTAIVGMRLAVSGVAIQTLVHNPLVDPHLLGISAGAGAGATMVIIFGALSGSPITPLAFGALLDAVMTTLAAGTFATTGGGLTPPCLVLSGVVLSAAFSALSSFMAFAGLDPRAVQSVIFWVLGSVADAIWAKTFSPLIVLVAVLLFFLVEVRQLDALATGESITATIDIDVTRSRTQVPALQAVLVGTFVAVSGGIGPVGLVIPHLTRILVGTTRRIVLPVVAFMGGLLLIWIDIIACVVGGSQGVSLSVVTGLVGAPPFLYLMSRSHYSYGGVE